ncbi:VWA domain-containing protein [Asticcacaulis sp. AC402]|uniref:VWA domain-containing protein n=1 Tax=Asticcacaulis sp. AC402 TaxID=1282361 RepID=UPI0003C3F028|nr:VWA domain-containing protein [Asticcacaulis sp. AC402]ESQ76769.1 hypothetical protein ABAC402_03650 [Asticcacaulis sp. AC402]
MIFALSSFVVLGFVGAAIDFSRVDSARRQLQDAADSAVLRTMAMKSASDESRALAADKAFAENFARPGVYGVAGELNRDVSDNVISQTYTVNATVTSYFGAFFGKDSYPVSVVSQAQTSLDMFEIAFVLDTTGSMAEANKMPNLKSSVDAAMASLLDDSGNNLSGSKIAVVPFNTQVRLNAATVTAVTGQGLLTGAGNCVVDRDRLSNYDVSADPAEKIKVKSLYPLRKCEESSLKPVQGLSDNITSARNFIKTLQPGGYTNITMGVQWGVEVLSPNQPFTDASAFGSDSARKFMIVVTDGDNTKSETSWNSSVIDKRTALACQNAKAKGITIYTVKIIQGNSNMLRQCASAPEYFYDLTNANQLNATMAGIFKSINKTRLSL